MKRKNGSLTRIPLREIRHPLSCTLWSTTHFPPVKLKNESSNVLAMFRVTCLSGNKHFGDKGLVGTLPY